MSDSVPVSRTLLTMGALALVSSLAVTAFLLGRATAPTPTVVVQAPSELAAPSPRPPARQAQREVDAETAAVPASPAPTVSTAAPLHPDPDHREAVRAYFQALEREQGGIMDSLDAQALVQQALTGDTSGIDQLIGQHGARMERLSRLSTPPPCEVHHTRLMALGRDGLSVMTRLRDGIASNDINSLMGLQGDAGRLQRAQDELNELEAELKRKFGA